MKESLYGLLNLQQVDEEVDALRQHKRDYPARITELEGSMAQLADDRQSKKDQLAEQQSNLKHFSRQLDVAQESVTKHQTRMPEIKSNREYDAYQQEMMALHHAIDEYTEERKKATDEIARLSDLLEQEETEFDRRLNEHEREIAELRQKTQTIDDEVAGALERRKQVAASLSARVVSVYERVRLGKRKAVVRVLREACSGCWTNLPPQKINELRMSKRIIICDGCGRILVWDDRKETDPAGGT